MLRSLASLSRAQVLATRLPPVFVLPAREFASTSSAWASNARPSTSHQRPLPAQHRQNGQHFTDSYHLAERLTLLSRRCPSQLESALVLLKSSPPAVATVVPWNVALHECFHQRKFRLAYETWMDMKRRGIRPTTRSFGTFFKGCANLASSAGRARLGAGAEGIGRVRRVWAQWLVHAERILDKDDQLRSASGSRRSKRAAREDDSLAEAVESDESADDINNLPSNNFLSFLARTNQKELMLETFDSMPDEGPLSADIVTYSIVLSALKPLVASASTAEEALVHFSSALKVWERLESRSGLVPDTETTSLMISLCRASPRPQDQLHGLTLAQDSFGLFLTADAYKLDLAETPAPKVDMDSVALSNVLTLVTKLQKHNLVVEWFDQVRDHPKRFGDIVEHWQCDLVMVALGYKKDAQAAEDLLGWMHRSKKAELQPTLSTFTNALQVCWRAADLSRACRLLSLMTGQSIPSATQSVAEMTEDPLQLATDKAEENSAARTKQTETFPAESRTVSTLLQTALSTRDRGNIFRTLEIASKLGFGSSKYDLRAERQAAEEDGEQRRPRKRREEREGPYAFFWQFKLAEVTERALERVLQGGEGHLSKEQRRELYDWRQSVLEWLEANESVGKSGGADAEESMRKRREELGLRGSQAAGRKYIARRAGQFKPEEGEEGEDGKRLNRKQRRALARGDSIEPAAAESVEEDAGFRVSTRSESQEPEPRRSPRFERQDAPPSRPRSRRDNDDERPPRRSFDRRNDEDYAPAGRREGYSAAPHQSRSYAGRETPYRSNNRRESSGGYKSSRDFGGREDRGSREGSRQKGWDEL